MRLLRRLVPQIGFMTVAGFAWNHRGTVVRLGDLALRAPRLVRDDGTAELASHARAVLALDAAMPTDMSVRISGIENGSVTLHGDPGGHAVSAATEVLCKVKGVTDVRTDGATHATADTAYAAAD
jgi:hypothetical protein